MSKKKKQEKRKEDRDVTITESPDPHSIEQETLRMKNMAEFAKFSFELEEKREQSLIRQSGQMLMAFSVTSAALLMAVPILLENTHIPKNMVILSSGIVLAFMLISMVLAVISQWRFSYTTMLDGRELLRRVEADINNHRFQPQYDSQWINQLKEIQNSKKNNNDTRCCLIKASMIVFFTAIANLFICSLMMGCLR